jgi:hypothetical protein
MNSMDADSLRALVLTPIVTPELHRLYDDWRARCRAGRLPSAADLAIADLPYLAGKLLLVDVLRTPLRFRYRVVGANLATGLPVDMTGKMVDEHPNAEFRRVALGVYTQVATSGRPIGVHRDVVMDKRLRRYDALHLPLADDGATVDAIMVAICHLSGRPGRETPPR